LIDGEANPETKRFNRRRKIMSQQKQTSAPRWESIARRHPVIYFLLILALAFLTGPFMIAANNVTAVLYKDF